LTAAATTPNHGRQRARYDALRRRVFDDAMQSAERWGLGWVIPFNVFVLAFLVARGESPTLAFAQAGALLVSLGSYLVRSSNCPTGSRGRHMLAATFCYFMWIATTGGFASPLLVTGLPILFAVAMLPMRYAMRAAFFVFFSIGVVAIGVVLRQLPPPLAPVGGMMSTEYVVLSAMSMAFAAVGFLQKGDRIADVYERVAFELAERREEICTENEDRTKALEGIAARLAHEVKNPLAAIKGLSTHMARTTEDEKMAERLAIVAAEADRLQSIVDGFLSFSRGLEEIHAAPTKPRELARELTVLLETRAADMGVALEVKGDENLEINADARKLRQALLNLVLNAMQATPAGKKVTLEVAKRCEGGAVIRVVDQGAGMTPEVLARIRKPYFTTREGGTGLGIAVARGLIEQHGGSMTYESAPGKGTTVTIELPACCEKAACAQKLPNPAREREPAAV
jgi:signal transduction histidine kinase